MFQRTLSEWANMRSIEIKRGEGARASLQLFQYLFSLEHTSLQDGVLMQLTAST